MNDGAIHHPTQDWLLTPTYGEVGPSPLRPTTREVLVEWFDAIAFWRDPSRLVPALCALYHLATFGVFGFFVVRYFSIPAIASVLVISTFIGTTYNTVWYHRYCSHRAFQFRSLAFARIFLWTNPLPFREESYVIPHRIHHSIPDERGDPHGPHLGWLGSYLATETVQKTNRDITPAAYQRLVKSLAHCGFVANSYKQFQRTGSVENVWHYGARALVANGFWFTLAYLAAGLPGIYAWISGGFLSWLVIRDFNFRGHASFLGTNTVGVSVNQAFYGIFGGEWHDNHHQLPHLAHSGFSWWQMDLPYGIIRLMKLCGIVSQYNSLASVKAGAAPHAEAQPVAGHQR
jgi:stearoyl-CoA desaturase (delta-9 desaturase)